jgi:hypothetical protein
MAATVDGNCSAMPFEAATAWRQQLAAMYLAVTVAATAKRQQQAAKQGAKMCVAKGP